MSTGTSAEMSNLSGQGQHQQDRVSAIGAAESIKRVSEDEDDVLDDEAYYASLGLPDYENQVLQPTPYDSRSGGDPVFFGSIGLEMESSDFSSTASKEHTASDKSLVCTSCARRLFMVAQIYAPVDHARSLVIFGCNTPECSNNSSTWRVLRTQDTNDTDPWKLGKNQQQKKDHDNIASSRSTRPGASRGELEKEAIYDHLKPKSMSSSDNLKFAAHSDTDSGSAFFDANSVGDWMVDDNFPADDPFSLDSDDNSNDNTESLEELLRLRDLSLQQKCEPTVSVKAETPNSQPSPAAPSAPTYSQPPAPTTAGDFNVASSASKDRFRCHYFYSMDEPSADQVAYDSVAISVQKAMKLYGKSVNLGAQQTEGMNAIDKYEAAPAGEIALHHYQERILRAPTQCVRYAYGGKPLWPSTKEIPSVPDCPGCGGTRVFEMQLMSPILHVLDVDNHPSASEHSDFGLNPCSEVVASAASTNRGGSTTRGSKDTPVTNGSSAARTMPKNAKTAKKRSKKRKQARKQANAKSQALPSEPISQPKTRRIDGGGMDFATVLIYSCENSCTQNGEEIAIVHEAL